LGVILLSLPLRPRRSGRQLALLGLLLATILALTGWNMFQPPRTEIVGPVEIIIPPKATARDIAFLLEERELIRSSLAFRILTKLRNLDSNLKAGRYLFSPGDTPAAILTSLVQGNVSEPQVVVTIPEGYTVLQMANLFEEKGVTKRNDFLEAAQSHELRSEYFAEPPKDGTRVLWEGFFFPDTYSFRPNTPALEVAQRMLTRMDQVWAEVSAGKSDLPLELSPREIVTLASLVEREAKAAEERPLIAQVFYNRLEARMNLQSCATVQYLLPQPKARLLKADTLIPSPYNTYLNPGLPPGPIAAPGKDSLKAVLSPEATDYLYFVAKPDGTHAFSTTYQGHLANRRRYSN
jgi:UPF0755 protein